MTTVARITHPLHPGALPMGSTELYALGVHVPRPDAGAMPACELCGSDPDLYCPADQAFLCRACDFQVHCANFLVSRHWRSALCQCCRQDTGVAVHGGGDAMPSRSTGEGLALSGLHQFAAAGASDMPGHPHRSPSSASGLLCHACSHASAAPPLLPRKRSLAQEILFSAAQDLPFSTSSHIQQHVSFLGSFGEEVRLPQRNEEVRLLPQRGKASRTKKARLDSRPRSGPGLAFDSESDAALHTPPPLIQLHRHCSLEPALASANSTSCMGSSGGPELLLCPRAAQDCSAAAAAAAAAHQSALGELGRRHSECPGIGASAAGKPMGQSLAPAPQQEMLNPALGHRPASSTSSLCSTTGRASALKPRRSHSDRLLSRCHGRKITGRDCGAVTLLAAATGRHSSRERNEECEEHTPLLQGPPLACRSPPPLKLNPFPFPFPAAPAPAPAPERGPAEAAGRGEGRDEEVQAGANCSEVSSERPPLGGPASSRLRRVLKSWSASLGLPSDSTLSLSFHLFQRSLLKLKRGEVAASFLRVMLAACLWTAAKLIELRVQLPGAAEVAAVTAVQVSDLRKAEVDLLKLLDWQPLQFYTQSA